MEDWLYIQLVCLILNCRQLEKSANFVAFLVFTFFSGIGVLCLAHSLKINGSGCFVPEDQCTTSKYVYCYSPKEEVPH